VPDIDEPDVLDGLVEAWGWRLGRRVEVTVVQVRVGVLDVGWALPRVVVRVGRGGIPRDLPKERRGESAPAARPDAQAAFDLDVSL
jgi:hypothetical protein